MSVKYLSKDWADAMSSAIAEDQDMRMYAKGQEILIRLQVEGKPDQGDGFYLWFADGQVSIVLEAPREPDATGTISYENGAKLMRGELKGSVAMMTGKLKVDGDVVKVLRAGNGLQHLPVIAETLDVEY